MTEHSNEPFMEKFYQTLYITFKCNIFFCILKTVRVSDQGAMDKNLVYLWETHFLHS